MPNISRINDLTDLLKLRTLQNNQTVNFNGKHLYLLNDIDLSNCYVNGVSSWIPIATKDNPFRGIFHGNEHIISNLKITTISNYQGFFAQNNGTITELVVSRKYNSK